jgi:hypothetical protein
MQSENLRKVLLFQMAAETRRLAGTNIIWSFVDFATKRALSLVRRRTLAKGQWEEGSHGSCAHVRQICRGVARRSPPFHFLSERFR